MDEENFGQTVSIELRPGGKETRVTDENKDEYIQVNTNITNQRVFYKFWCRCSVKMFPILTSVFLPQLVIEWRFINRVRRQMDQVDIALIIISA